MTDKDWSQHRDKKNQHEHSRNTEPNASPHASRVPTLPLYQPCTRLKRPHLRNPARRRATPAGPTLRHQSPPLLHSPRPLHPRRESDSERCKEPGTEQTDALWRARKKEGGSQRGPRCARTWRRARGEFTARSGKVRIERDSSGRWSELGRTHER